MAPSTQPQNLVHLISVNTSIPSLLEKVVSGTSHVYSDTVHGRCEHNQTKEVDFYKKDLTHFCHKSISLF